MFKKLSVLLVFILAFAVVLCGCSADKKDDYIINQGDVIKIGVVLPMTEDITLSEKLLDGIEYASSLASSVQIDKSYNVELVVKDINSSYEQIVQEFNDEKVAAVISLDNRLMNDKTFTDCFNNSCVPVLFVNLNDTVSSDNKNVLTLSAPVSFEASTAASYVLSEGYQSGAVICAYNSDYNSTCADTFENTFTTNGGKSITKYFYSGNNSNYDAKVIAAGGFDFIYINADDKTASDICVELTKAGVTSQFIVDEVMDKTFFANEVYNNIKFISRFEEDNNNYIGSDFLNNYSQSADIAITDVTAVTAYGYDAYMCVYNALVDFNRNDVMLGASDNKKSESGVIGDITVSDLLDKIKEIEYYGVTDTYKFSGSGTSDASHLYIDRVDNSTVIMLDRYDFNSDET